MSDEAAAGRRPIYPPTYLLLAFLLMMGLHRNPMYLGMVIGLTGVAVVAGSLTPFLVVPAFAILIERRFIRAEEAQLERTFGAPYVAYKARVRRWL